MPLEQLTLRDCPKLHDLTPLADMKLKKIQLPPRITKGLDMIRAMKSLESINDQPAAEFWKKWDEAKAK